MQVDVWGCLEKLRPEATLVNEEILIWGGVGIGFFSMSGKARSGWKKIPHESQMVIFSFPTSRFSRSGENKNLTTSGEATSGRICFLPQVLNHKWGMEILPWVTNGEFYQSLLLLRWGLTFLYCKWKWSILTFFFTLLTRTLFFSKADEKRKKFPLPWW